MTTITAALEGTRVHHATKAKMQRLEDALVAEYPGVELEVECEEDSKDYTLVAFCGDARSEWEKEVPALTDVLESLLEQGATEDDLTGGEDEEDEDEPAPRSVVREEYRQEYRVASTNKQTNGDWLAETLTDLFWDPKEGFNVVGFEALLDHNGVDMSAPWARVLGTKGGAGRFRMNGRQALEKRLCVTGCLKAGEVEYTAESDAGFAGWLADAKERHAGFLAKIAKKAAKEDQERNAPTPTE